MTTAYINRISTGVPAHDVHESFLAFARWLLAQNGHSHERFERMAKMANIAHRYSCVDPSSGFYAFGRFPSTAERMRAFAVHAPDLAAATIERLDLGPDRDRITHVVICLAAPVSPPPGSISK